MIRIEKGTTRELFLNESFSESIVVEDHATITLFSVKTHGWKERQTLVIELDGEGAEVMCVIVCIGKGDAAFPFDIKIEHRAPATKSRVACRSALYDSSSVDSTGAIRIHADARGAETSFSHHALLLGEAVRAKVIPSLEIEHDDVKAGHAVTIGRLDDEILFTCAARGLDRSRAEELLVEGFIRADASLISTQETRELFEETTSFLLSKGYCFG